jgi:hypothetical protein
MKTKILQSIILMTTAILLSACGTALPKHDFGDEYGWTCVTEEQAEGQDTIVVGKDRHCVLVKTDRDDTKDFFIRKYEWKHLPEMPDLP